MNKKEWRKDEKSIYLPPDKPVWITLPTMRFACISGKGNPNSPEFGASIEALYAYSYTLKMGLKKLPSPPEGYGDYTVYPLEGIWDLSEEGRQRYRESGGIIDKDDLIYTLMIRQPDFAEDSLLTQMKEQAIKKKKLPLLEQIVFEILTEGSCVQMLHTGSFDSEGESFAQMEEFCREQGLTRTSKIHREIYLSDFRRVSEEKRKTVLRFQVD